MGETAVLARPASETAGNDYYPPATFEESAVETSPEIESAKIEIERTRSEMSETIDAIKAQLSPERLVAEAKEAVVEAAHEKVDEVKHAVMDKVSDVAHGASALASNVVATVSDAAHSLGDKASALTDTAKEKWNDLTAQRRRERERRSYRGGRGGRSRCRRYEDERNRRFTDGYDPRESDPDRAGGYRCGLADCRCHPQTAEAQ